MSYASENPTPPIKRATLKDVAAAVGVSVATVSYVLNGKHVDRVSANTRRRVLKAVDQLNYTPNATARSLVMSRSSTLGVFLPQHLEHVLAEPGTDRMLSGIVQKASLEDYQVELAIEGSDPRKYAVDGWICLRPHKPMPILESRRLPLLYVDPLFESRFPTLKPANKEAASMLANAIRNTSKRIAFVEQGSSNNTNMSIAERRNTLCEQVKDFASIECFSPQSSTTESIEERVINETNAFESFDTLIAADEALGTRLLKSLLERGFAIPQKLNVMAFGDSGVSQWMYPKLTLVDLKLHELAYRATRILIQHIKQTEVTSSLKLEGAPTPEYIKGATSNT